MGSCIAELGKTLWDELIKRAIAELRYPCCYTCIAEDFEKEKKRLEVERETVGQRVEVAKNRGERIQSKANSFEEQANELIHEDTKTKKTHFFGLCPDCIWQYKRGKELAERTEDIKKLRKNPENLVHVGLPSPVPDVDRHSSKDYISFKSRESKINALLEALTSDNNYITGLQGMGGTGKTTLAKEVGKELKQVGRFTRVIITTVSFTPDIKKIQDDIAGPLGLKWDDCTNSERPAKLWKRLTNGEKILLILDDVWGPLNFEEIGIPSSDNCQGCKVLLTTRKLQVCNQMECGRTIDLQLLPEEEARIMFEKHAGTSCESLLQKGHEIVKECKGLPVAIAIIGSSLKGSRSLEEWEVALNSLQKHMPTDEKDADENLVAIYKSLKYSFDYMKDEKAKGLFLLCSVFREDERISIGILTKYGIGGGLFGENYDKYNDARREVVVAKNKLIDSCLLLKDVEGSVKMHDLVRDAAKWIGNNCIQEVNFSNNKSQKVLVERGKNIEYLLCHGKGMDVFSMGFDGSKLEILIVSIDETNSMEIPNSFFRNMTRLRVFHLLNNTRSWEMQSAQSLPQSIQSLTNIRSLLLESFKLGDMSILGNLRSLETVDLIRCSDVELPGEIAQLKKLRLLNLVDCEFTSESSNNTLEVIGRCSSLEELYLINNDGFLEDSVAIHQRITLPALQRYHLVRGYDEIINDSVSKCVSFPKIEAFVSQATFKFMVQTAEILGLEEIQGGWRNLMPEIVPIDKDMNDLKKLYLKSCSQLQCLIETHSHEQKVFDKLVVLELFKMENLEELCNGPLPSDFLKSLERLTIHDCNLRSNLFMRKLSLYSLKTIELWKCQELVSLFQLSTSRSLKLLEVLKINYCEKLENIIIDDVGEEIANKDNKSRGSMFPNLKTLEIILCPQLEVILPFHSAVDVPVLEYIYIYECNELNYIFGQYQHKHDKDLHQEVKDVLLGSLKGMQLYDLPNFIDIFPECDHPVCSSMKRSSSKDGSKAQLQSDPIKCNIFPWKYRHKLRSSTSTKIPLDQPQDCSIPSAPDLHYPYLWEPPQCLFKQSNILNNITWIELSNVSNIKSVFTLPIAQKLLLENLTIEKCGELKHIISGSGGNNGKDVFPRLKMLNVQQCEQLQYIFGHYSHHLQNHNEMHLHLPALNRLYLSCLPNFIGMCPENYYTTLPTLTEFALHGCAKFAIKYFINHLYSRHIEGLSGNESKAENIFCFDEMIEQQMNLGLQTIELGDMPQMTDLFVGLKNSFVLQNLLSIEIVRCEKLEVIFSGSISRCLPQLHNLIIQECKELKQIVEEEMEDKKMSNFLSPKTCFPKLRTLEVKDCNKLKCVFPTSVCEELPKLKVLIINEAYELKEVFGGEGDHKVEIPNLILVAFAELPSLCLGNQFQNVVHRMVLNCPKLSLTSTITLASFDIFRFSYSEIKMVLRLKNLYNMYTRKIDIQDTSNGNLIIETTEDQAASRYELTSSQVNTNHSIQASTAEDNQQENGIESNKSIFVETTTKQTPEAVQEFFENVSSLEIPSISNFSPTNSEVIREEPCPSPIDIPIHKTHSHELLDQQSMGEPCLMDQQQPLIEVDITYKIPQENNNLNETENQNIQEDSKSKKIATAIMSVDSETRHVPPIPLHAPQQKDIKINVEEGTTSTNMKIPTSSTHLESVSLQEDGDSKKTTPSFSAINVDSQKTTKTYALEASKSKPSPCIPSLDASQSPLMPFEGNSSQIVEDFASIIASELGQLVSKKHLASENLSLLTDFLMKHPSVRLTNKSLSNRYKGFAYNCLAELLKFLQTHSVLDVSGSSHSNFMDLLQDVCSFAFHKDWLDGVERRALFPSLQVSQDALQKLLDSKQQVTKEIEMLRLNIGILTQHVEDLKHQLTSSEAVLESIIQEEAQVSEAWVALSAPLGY